MKNESELEESQAMGAIRRLGFGCEKKDGLYITTDSKGQNLPTTASIEGLKVLLKSLREIHHFDNR